MPSIVLCAKQMLYPRKDKCSILSHGCIWNVTDNKAVLDPVEINSKNQWNEEECEGEAAVVVELTNVVSIASANLNTLSIWKLGVFCPHTRLQAKKG